MSESERSYSEREVAAIVRRAGELQAKVAEAPPKGMRRDDLHRIASELGIDSRFIDQAIVEGRPGSSSKFGMVATQERVLAGEPDFDQLGELALLTGGFGRQGMSQVGNVFVTTLRRGMGVYHVTVRRFPGETYIQARSIATLPFVLGFFLVFYGNMALMATLESLGVLASVWIPILVAILWIALVCMMLRPIVRKAHRRLGEVVEEFAGAVRPVEGATSSTVEQSSSEVRQRALG